MKFLVVLSIALACAAAQLKDEYSAPIVKSSFDISPEGSFQYAYETGNGIYAQSQGAIKNPSAEYPALEVQGGYKYTSPDGTPVEVTYIANELGFAPQGSHFPTSPPIPEAIARSLQYIASQPPAAGSPSKPAYSG